MAWQESQDKACPNKWKLYCTIKFESMHTFLSLICILVNVSSKLFRTEFVQAWSSDFCIFVMELFMPNFYKSITLFADFNRNIAIFTKFSLIHSNFCRTFIETSRILLNFHRKITDFTNTKIFFILTGELFCMCAYAFLHVLLIIFHIVHFSTFFTFLKS